MSLIKTEEEIEKTLNKAKKLLKGYVDKRSS